MNIKAILKSIFFFSIGIFILYLLYRATQSDYLIECAKNNIPENDCNVLDKLWNDFKSVRWFWIICVLLCYMISNISRARRWQLAIQPLGYTCSLLNAFLCLMIGYLSNLGLPRSGEFIRPVTLSRYENIPLEKLFGTIVTERIIDVLSLLITMGLTLIVAKDLFYNYLLENADLSKFSYLGSIYFWSIFFLIIIMFLIVLKTYWSKISQIRIVQNLLNTAKGFIEGVLSIRNLDRPVEFLFHSVLIWFMYFMMTYVCFFAYEPTELLSAGAGLVAFTFGAIGIVIPTPGGMGAYQFLVQEALIFYDISVIDAFSFANICFFSINIFCNVVLGILSLVVLPLVNQKTKN